MRKFLIRLLAIAFLPLLLGNAGCPLVPKIEDRTVELAVGATTTQSFAFSGSTNQQDIKGGPVDLDAEIDLSQVLSDNGIDASSLKSVTLAGVSYRITKGDPVRTRKIEAGSMYIQRGGSAEKPLVTDFTAQVGSTTDWVTVKLDKAGVDVVKLLLEDLLSIARSGRASIGGRNTTISYRVHGVPTPPTPNMDFVVEFKLNLTVVGSVKVTVVT